MTLEEHACICCDRVLDVEPTDNPIVIYPVYDGLIFRAHGNFGSRIFDPMPRLTEEMLQVIICDDCVKSKTKRVIRIHNIKRETIAGCEKFVP